MASLYPNMPYACYATAHNDPPNNGACTYDCDYTTSPESDPAVTSTDKSVPNRVSVPSKTSTSSYFTEYNTSLVVTIPSSNPTGYGEQLHIVL
jgi:hypothetical protein